MLDCGQSDKQTAENIFDIGVGCYKAKCFLPTDCEKTDKIVYIHAAIPDEAEKVWQHLSCKCVLVYLTGVDWNRDMSPWYRDKVFARGEDFLGGADAYLSVLCNRLIPETERALSLPKAAKRYLAGYSLGGLFALYSLYHTALFDGIGSVSGSLWYEGFLSYMEQHALCRVPERVYFSLGDQEDRGNSVMRTVAHRTEQIETRFREMGIRTIFERNPGNHFQDVPERIARGITWLVK